MHTLTVSKQMIAVGATASPEQAKLLRKFELYVVKLKGSNIKKIDALPKAQAFWKKLDKRWTPTMQTAFESAWSSKIGTSSITKISKEIKPIGLDEAKKYWKEVYFPSLHKDDKKFFIPILDKVTKKEYRQLWVLLDEIPHIVGNDWETVVAFKRTLSGKITTKWGWGSKTARTKFYETKIAKMFGLKLSTTEKKDGTKLQSPNVSYWESKSGTQYRNITVKITDTKPPSLREPLETVYATIKKKGMFTTAYPTTKGNTKVIKAAFTKVNDWRLSQGTRINVHSEGQYMGPDKKDPRVIYWIEYQLNIPIKQFKQEDRDRAELNRQYKSMSIQRAELDLH